MPAAEQGVARGQAAIAEGGLVGRLTEIGSRAARVLLITDLNSRIPVVIHGSRTSAVLAGDNSDRPRLVFASEPKAIRIGDRVVTSGEGGVFPPGLPVGVVAAIDPTARASSPMPSCRSSITCCWSITGWPAALPQPAPAGPGQKRPGKIAAAPTTRGRAERWRPNLSSFPSAPRANRGLARFLPTATIVVAAALSLLPLPIPGYAALTPAFALMAVYHWSVYRPDLLPPSGLFAIGFAQDLLIGAALPASALVLLLARAAVLRYRRHFVGRPFPFAWAGFAALAAAVDCSGCGRCIACCSSTCSICGPRSFAALLTVALFPAASLALGRSQRALIGASA